MKKISIIGGNGFLGRVLSKQLNKEDIKHKIYDINTSSDCTNLEFCDVTNEKSLDPLEKNSIIINLAAVHRDDVKPISKYDEVNIDGAKNICKVARKKDINTIIFTSSVAVYGFAKPNTDENGDINYFNDYGRTKYFAEKEYIKWFNESPELRNLIIIRPTVIFGKGNRGNVFNLLNQIASRRFIMFGNGKNVKSMAYVENVAEFIKFVIKSEFKGFKKYNYIDKPDLNMNDLVSLTRKYLFGKDNVGMRLPSRIGFLIGAFADVIAMIIRKPLPVSKIRVKKFMSTTSFSTNVNKTGFVPNASLKDGLFETLNHEFVDKD